MQAHALAFALLVAIASANVRVVADQNVLGIPDVTCQNSSEWSVHDYGAPATGHLLFLPQDGNLEECGYTNYGLFLFTDDDCQTLQDNGVGGTGYALACNTDRPVDWDGDLEFAFGGAYLVSDTGDGSTSGGLACYGTLGHHPQGSTVYVNDLVFPTVAFSVTADFADPSSPTPPGEADCGDNVIQPCDPTPPDESTLPQPVGGGVDVVNALLYSLFNSDGTTCTVGDVSKSCLNRCVLDFPPGADGAYIVFVGPSLTGNNGEPTLATQGHVSTGNHPPIPPLLWECSDVADNDGDGSVDWLFDPDCQGPLDDDESQ